jgi:LacI family transcriptional regulator
MTQTSNGKGLSSPSSSEGKRATINDVSRKAGVSVSAVSKVLRNAYGVSEEMRNKVGRAIDDLGYRPKTAARSMRGKSYSVGIVLDLDSPLPTQVANSMSRSFDKTPYQAILAAGTKEGNRQKVAVQALLDRQIDGLVIIAPWMEVEWIESVAAKLPTILVARNGVGKNYDSVTDNAFEGAYAMTEYLINLGHRRIAYTTAPDGGMKAPFVLSHVVRQDGYEQAMKVHGLRTEVVMAEYTEEAGYKAGLELFGREVPPTAIFAGADIAALGVMRAAYAKGLRIPQDVTVVGYDNIFSSGLHGIDLTTVDQKSEQLAQIGSDLMLERLDEGRTEPVYRIETPKLIVRGTSGPVLK